MASGKHRWYDYLLTFLDSKGEKRWITVSIESYGNKEEDRKNYEEYVDNYLTPQYDIKKILDKQTLSADLHTQYLLCKIKGDGIVNGAKPAVLQPLATPLITTPTRKVSNSIA